MLGAGVALNGQWIAPYTGSNSGLVVVDIDEVGDHFEGTACAWDSNPDYPSSMIRFRTKDKSSVQHLENVSVNPVDRTGAFLSEADMAQYTAKGLSFPATTDVDFDLVGNKLSLKWTTAVGTFGSASATASKTHAGKGSDLIPLSVKNWDQFKIYVNKLERNSWLGDLDSNQD
jgi:hypothetical protein